MASARAGQEGLDGTLIAAALRLARFGMIVGSRDFEMKGSQR